MTAATSATIRVRLLEELRLDLIGPRADNELLADRPTVYYLAGILYPGGVQQDPGEDEDLDTTDTDSDDIDADSGTPERVNFAQSMNPSAIGLSFAVDHTATALQAEVSYGLYSQQSLPAGQGRARSRWERHPVVRQVDLTLELGYHKEPLPGGAQLEWLVRAPAAGARNLSVFLVNRNQARDPVQVDDSECIFQPHFLVRGLPDTRPIIHREPPGILPPDSDLESYRLLYRDCYEFAGGHNCAADWRDQQADHAGTVETALIPAYEIPPTTTEVPPITPRLAAGLDLDMQVLARASQPGEVQDRLAPLLDGYKHWIDERAGEIINLPTPDLQATARVHLDRCTEALTRMQAGLDLITRDAQVFAAFRFANQAMLLQRSHSQWAKDRRKGRQVPVTPRLIGAWRPFQIAFIMLNLPGVVNPTGPDRALVDLLWFPTGGGKTEAYLGLAAFTMALRRLRGRLSRFESDGGVTVIMRYTLRLLTTQQFQRAAALICACEYLRRQDPRRWGQQPFQIGLWVGSGATPNSITEAHEALDKLRGGGDVREGNPVRLTSCPWCGEALTWRDYTINAEQERLVVTCSRDGCEFHDAARRPDRTLPVLMVDDDIYHRCPTMIMATADKFARLPWKPATMALFGQVDRYCPRHGYLWPTEEHPGTHRAAGSFPPTGPQPCSPFLPPDLIIQDELHLISGPLGTLMGLYETAVDLLCARIDADRHLIRPKIVASTATIRRADDQVRNLFDREVRLFPPSGLQAGDSFFATTSGIANQPGRCYVGVYAPGRSVKTALVRVYALLLQEAREALAREGPPADPYTTLIGYFNSLRELGGALRLVEDDIVQRVGYLANRKGSRARPISTEDIELTSRIASAKIPEILDRLEIRAGTAGALDVLLATNMISVGVDVDRLGLMVVNGQPKASAEYIQATSRVGRQLPGLVVTVYNWSRPRDISHYEHFRPYHEAIYRHVEATSVTPFAPRARDRAFHAVLIALARLLQHNWTTNDSASLFQRNHPTVLRIRDYILARINSIEPMARSEADRQLTELMDWWENRARLASRSLRYQDNPYKPAQRSEVLMHPAEEHRLGGSRPTLNSLREVEAESRLFIP